MNEWKSRFVLGITGSMGSGKSTVAHLFEKFGATRISADEIARSFTDSKSDVKGELVELLGVQILDEKGNIDRKRIAGIVFSDKTALEKLNGFMHPRIRQKTLDLIRSVEDGRIIAWEAPLLFEAKGETICDATLTVYASYAEAWGRVQKRDQITEDEFKKRLASQMDIEKKMAASDFNIANDKGLTHLEEESKVIYTEIMNKKIS